MTMETVKNGANWHGNTENQAHHWEFYKTPQGLWNWRLVAPEGWDVSKNQWEQNAAWNDKTWNAAISNNSSWNTLRKKIDWIEVSHSPHGYKSKEECLSSAQKNGWTA